MFLCILNHQNKLTSDSSSTTRGYAKISVTLKSRNFVTHAALGQNEYYVDGSNTNNFYCNDK